MIAYLPFNPLIIRRRVILDYKQILKVILDIGEQMINSGANAIVMKTDDLAELKIAFQRVLDGENYFSDHFREACEEMANYQTLSEREIEILKLISEGISSKDIAKRIFRTQDTVEFHRKNIMRKLGANNMAQLVKEGIAKGYIN